MAGWSFSDGSESKESACDAGDLGSISGLGRSLGGGPGNPLHYSCLENPHGQRNMAGYSPWSCQQLDMTEQLSTAQHRINPWVRKIPWRRKWQSTPVFLPGESQGRGRLVGCRLWGHTESDTTETTQQQQHYYNNFLNI